MAYVRRPRISCTIRQTTDEALQRRVEATGLPLSQIVDAALRRALNVPEVPLPLPLPEQEERVAS